MAELDLPVPQRWSPKRKRELLEIIRATPERRTEVMMHYSISEEELHLWEVSERQGDLRVTTIQQRRRPR